MLSNDDVVPALLDACPSLADVWARIANHAVHLTEDGSRLDYSDASDLASAIVDQYRAGNTSEVQAAFDVFERFLIDGRPETQELIAIGYLEDVQSASFDASIPLDDWLQYMGPETMRWWRGVRAFWEEGRVPVSPVDTGSIETASTANWIRRLFGKRRGSGVS